MLIQTESTRRYMQPPVGTNYLRDQIDIRSVEAGRMDKGSVIDFYTTSKNEKYRFGPSFETTAWVSEFPEQKRLQSADGALSIMAPWSDMVVERIAANFPAENIHFDNEESKSVFNYVMLRGMEGDRCAQRYARFKNDGYVEPHNLELCAEYPLKEYQQVPLLNSMYNPAYALFMEQGTGKTAIPIARICNEARDATEMYRVLIVCPLAVRTNWKEEFYKFSTQPGSVSIVHGNAMDRCTQIAEAFAKPRSEDCKFQAMIITYDSLRETLPTFINMWEHLGWFFDLVVMDESHYIKNAGNKRTNACWDLRRISKSRMALTGTPITNTALDLYAQWQALDYGLSGFGSKAAFNRFHGRYINKGGWDVFDSLQNAEFLQERATRTSFIVRSDEVLDLPDQNWDVWECEMENDQTDFYIQLRDQLMVEIEEDIANSTNLSMTVSNSLTKLLRLGQVAAGFWCPDPEVDPDTLEESDHDIQYFASDPKIEAFFDMFDSHPTNEKMILCSKWLPSLKRLSEAADQRGIKHVLYHGRIPGHKRQPLVDQFNNDPDTRLMIVNQHAGGTGLNLLGYPIPGQSKSDRLYQETGLTPETWPTNATWMVFHSQGWEYAVWSQMQKRLHRTGTRKPIRYTTMLALNSDRCPNAIDLEILHALERKRDNALAVTDVREILASLRMAA